MCRRVVRWFIALLNIKVNHGAIKEEKSRPLPRWEPRGGQQGRPGAPQVPPAGFIPAGEEDGSQSENFSVSARCQERISSGGDVQVTSTLIIPCREIKLYNADFYINHKFINNFNAEL